MNELIAHPGIVVLAFVLLAIYALGATLSARSANALAQSNKHRADAESRGMDAQVNLTGIMSKQLTEARQEAEGYKRATEELRAVELQRGNALGRIAISLFSENNNVTDEQCVTEVNRVQHELRSIDEILARRPALDKPTRCENIAHAISVAGQSDELKRHSRFGILTFRTDKVKNGGGEAVGHYPILLVTPAGKEVPVRFTQNQIDRGMESAEKAIKDGDFNT